MDKQQMSQGIPEVEMFAFKMACVDLHEQRLKESEGVSHRYVRESAGGRRNSSEKPCGGTVSEQWQMG